MDQSTPNGWVRALAGALLATVVILVVIMLVSGAVIPPLIVISAIFIPVAWAVLRWHEKRWLLIVATVLALLAILGNIPFLVGDLAHPESGMTFAPSVLSLLAALVAIIAGVAAILRLPDVAARPVVGGAAVLALVAVVIAVVATVGVESDVKSQNDIDVIAQGVKYPETLTAKAGGAAFFVENKDRVRHTFVIEDLDVKHEVPASTNRRIEVSLKAGSYEFHCDVPGHEDMKGTLQVAP